MKKGSMALLICPNPWRAASRFFAATIAFAPIDIPINIVRPLASFSIIAAFLTYKGATAPKPPTVVTEVEKRAVAEALPPLALKGSGLYEEQGCAACHTINGA
jgi:hypothetical protein